MFDLPFAIALFVLALVVLDLVALRFGVDSRTSALLRDPARRDI